MNKMEYQFGYPQAKRVMMINDGVDHAREFHSEMYQGKLHQLPVIEVHIESLLYRLENIRTISNQKEWLIRHKEMPRDFFTSDPGAIEVQETQHVLLKEIVKKDKLIDAFKIKKNKSKRLQKYPLIISDEGVVVNGNCRLCAWRELYYSDKDAYQHFPMIKVAVLPNHDPQGMYDLEVELQLDEPQKKDYAWHAVAADYKAKIDQGYDIERIASKRNVSVKDIRNIIECYECAAEYLELSGHLDEWSRVDKADFAFKKIVAGRKKLDKPGEKSLFQEITQAMLSQPAEGDRLYNQIPKVVDHLKSIAPKLQEVFDIKVAQSNDENINVLIGGDSNNIDLLNAQIANGIHNSEDSALVVSTVLSAIADAEEIEKEKKKKVFVFEQVKRAATELTTAITNITDTMSKDGVDKQLDSIEASCAILRDWIKKYGN